MRTVYINKDAVMLLRESVIRETLPDFILSDIENNSTTFGKNPAFPDGENGSFLKELYEKHFEEVVSDVKSLKKLEDVKSSDINHALGEIIEKCKEEERPVRDKLEALCAKLVIEEFNIPEDSVSLDMKLVDQVEIDGMLVQFDAIHDKDDYSREISDTDFNGEVSKRQVISALNIGYGMLRSADIRDYVSQIYEINPKLVDLYHRFIVLNEYALFTNSHKKMSEKNNLQIGSVELKVSQVDEVPGIKSCGVIFPVLLCESCRGLMELFSSHGLPDNKKVSSEVLKRTDYLLAEPWYMRTGKLLWEIILEQCNGFDTELLPYLYRRMCRLSINDFNSFMQHILSRSEKGVRMLSILVSKAREDAEECEKDMMDTPDVDNGVITDNYIKEEEL